VRVGGVRADGDRCGAERERSAQHRADVAGIVDAPERDAERPRGLPPALLVDREGARPGAEDRDPREGLRVDLLTGQAAPGRREALHRPPPGRVSRRQQILALRDEARVAAALEPADLLELRVVVAGDYGWQNEKGRRS